MTVHNRTGITRCKKQVWHFHGQMQTLSDLEDGVDVGPDDRGGVGHEVADHAGALLLVPAVAAVLHLRQQLVERLAERGHDVGLR